MVEVHATCSPAPMSGGTMGTALQSLRAVGEAEGELSAAESAKVEAAVQVMEQHAEGVARPTKRIDGEVDETELQLKDHIKQLQEQLHKAHEEVAMLHSELDLPPNDMAHLQDRLGGSTGDKELEKQKGEYEQQFNERNEVLLEEISALKAAHAEKDEETRQLEDKLVELETAEEDQRQLNARRDGELQAQLQQLRAMNETLRKRSEALTDDLNEVVAMVDELLACAGESSERKEAWGQKSWGSWREGWTLAEKLQELARRWHSMLERPTGPRGGAGLDQLERAMQNHAISPDRQQHPDTPSGPKPNRRSPRPLSAREVQSAQEQVRAQGKLVNKLRGEIETLRVEHSDMDMLMSEAAKALNRESRRVAALKKELEQARRALERSQQEVEVAQSERVEADAMMEEAAQVITRERARAQRLERELAQHRLGTY